jgi:hypothetical protein
VPGEGHALFRRTLPQKLEVCGAEMPPRGKCLQVVAEGAGLTEQRRLPGLHNSAGISDAQAVLNTRRRVVRATRPTAQLGTQLGPLLLKYVVFDAESLILVEVTHLSVELAHF